MTTIKLSCPLAGPRGRTNWTMAPGLVRYHQIGTDDSNPEFFLSFITILDEKAFSGLQRPDGVDFGIEVPELIHI